MVFPRDPDIGTAQEDGHGHSGVFNWGLSSKEEPPGALSPAEELGRAGVAQEAPRLGPSMGERDLTPGSSGCQNEPKPLYLASGRQGRLLRAPVSALWEEYTCLHTENLSAMKAKQFRPSLKNVNNN